MSQPQGKSKWALFWQRFWNPPPPPAPPRTQPKEIVTSKARSSSTITPAEFEARVVSTAKVLAGGGIVSMFHYQLARGQVRNELASKGITVMDGDMAEAAAEAGGWGKI